MLIQVEQPTPAVSAVRNTLPRRSLTNWIAWAALPVLVLLCVTAHIGSSLTYVFTPISFVVGVYFLMYSSADYVRFVIAMYAFSALIQRLAGGGITGGSNPILLAPYLVTGLTAFGMLRPSRQTSPMLPLTLATLGIAYGFAVGIVKVHDISLLKSALRWIVPLLFGLFCARQQNKRELRDAFLQSTLWCAVFVAAYGIFQFVFAPPWDAEWLIATQANGSGGSFGSPVPFGIRVFSTMGNPGACAAFCGLGLICALRVQSFMKYLIMPLMVVTLAITLIRTTWFSTIFLLILLIWKLPSRDRFRTVTIVPLILAGFAVLVLPFMNPKTTEALADRVSSFGSIKADDSYLARKRGIELSLDMLATEPFGMGMGYQDSSMFLRSSIASISNIGGHDIGAVEIPVELGYLGTLLYLAAMLVVSFRLIRVLISGNLSDSLLAGLGLSVWLLFSSTNAIIGYEGMLFWIAGGLLMEPTTCHEVASPRLLGLRNTSVK